MASELCWDCPSAGQSAQPPVTVLVKAMTLPIAQPKEERQHENVDGEPPVKRQRLEDVRRENAELDDGSNLVRKHPLGIRPSGNALASAVNLKRACGSFAVLPDELLIQFLETLAAEDVLRLGITCRALHAFTRNEELWRALFVK